MRTLLACIAGLFVGGCVAGAVCCMGDTAVECTSYVLDEAPVLEECKVLDNG